MDIINKNRSDLFHRIEQPIFIVGCCNSGTKILWRTLLSHPQLSGPQSEGQDIRELPSCMRHFLGKQTFRMFAHPKFKGAYRLTEKDFEKDIAERIAVVYADHCETGKRFIEKSPANSMRMRFLQSIFPDAAFIIMIRNGLAVTEGIRRKRMCDPDRPHMAGLTTTIKEAAEQWANANRILINDQKYLRKSMIVKYEDLVTDTSDVLSLILDFLDLDIQDFFIPTFETDHNDKQIDRLTESEIQVALQIISELSIKLGYSEPLNKYLFSKGERPYESSVDSARHRGVSF